MTNTEFTSNYHKNLPAVKNFARKLTRNMVDTKELVQVAMVKAYKSKHTFREGSNFKNWIFTIVKNTFITQYNKRKKRGVVSAPIEDLNFAVRTHYITKNRALSNIRIKELWRYIDTLSEKSKEPFKLYVQGYKYDEIAKNLNIPIGTVKSRINFARTKLKRIISRQNFIAA